MVKVIKITFLSLIILALITFMILFMNGDFKFKSYKSTLIYDEIYEINNINKVSVNVKSSDINFYKSDTDKAIIKVYGRKKDKVTVSEKDSALYIEKEKTERCVGFCFGEVKIDIYLPNSYEGKIDVKATSGDITSRLNTFNDYTFKVTSGDVEIEKASSIVGKTTSGDLELGNVTSYIDFVATSGDVEIDNLTITKNSSIEVTSGDIEIDNIGDMYISTSVKSGDVKINNNNRHAEYELSIKTTSGDINVK